MKDNENEEIDIESLIDQLEAIDAGEGVEISGRVYRITSPVDSVGRPSTELVCKVNELVDEDYIGRLFGGGRYRVKYLIRNGEKTYKKNYLYTVSSEYDKFVQKPEPKKESPATTETGNFLNNFLNSLTAEKITAFGLAIKAVKEFFAPPPPPDYTQLIQAVLSQRGPSVSDSIVIKAMDSLQNQNKQITPPQPQKSLLEQMRELNEVKEMFKEELQEDSQDNEDGENMNLLLKTAMEYLPLLLQKNNGDFRKVGEQANENPLVKNLISNDPELAQVFLEKAKEKYGFENAAQLAEGFGYQIKNADGEGANNNV